MVRQAYFNHLAATGALVGVSGGLLWDISLFAFGGSGISRGFLLTSLTAIPDLLVSWRTGIGPAFIGAAGGVTYWSVKIISDN